MVKVRELGGHVGAIALSFVLACGSAERNKPSSTGGSDAEGGHSATQGGSTAGRAPGGASSTAGASTAGGMTSGGAGSSMGGSAGSGDEPGGAGGTAQGGAASKGEHCEGGDVIPDVQFASISSSCFGDSLRFELPNPVGASVDDIVLSEPLTPGVPSAASFEMVSSGKVRLELWGTDAECGKAKELLWAGDASSKIVCASFTPSMAHTHLLSVLRPITGGNYVVKIKSLARCGAGTCAEPDGTGRTESMPVSRTQSSYESVVDFNYRGFGAKLGIYGRLFALGENRLPVGQTMAVTTGIFKAPTPFEPYGDAYYCIGAGSTVTDNGDAGIEVSLTNITRLGTCAERKGSGTLGMSWTNFHGVLTSSWPALALDDDIVNGGCKGKACDWQFMTTTRLTWVDFLTAGDMGDYFTPTLMQSGLTEAAVFNQAAAGAPLELACGTTGTGYYAPAGTTTFDVTDLGSPAACPGTAITDSSAKFLIY